MFLLIFFAILIIFSLFIYFYFTFPPGWKELAAVDGPMETPILGNITDWQTTDLAEMTEVLLNLWQMFKSPMRIKFFHKYFIHVWKAEHVETILKDTQNIKKSVDYKHLLPWLGQGLLVSSGTKWRNRRKLLTPTFHFQILKDFIPIFNEQAKVLLKILDEKSDGEAFNFSPLASRLAIDVICETAMGVKWNTQTNQACPFAEGVYELSDLVLYRMVTPWFWYDFPWKFTPKGRRYYSLIKQLRKITTGIILERESKMHEKIEEKNFEKKHKPFLELLLEMKAEGQLNDEDIREEVDTIMLEGHDTTATALTWMLFRLGSEPKIQEKLYEEVIGIVGEENEVNEDHLPQLKFVDLVLKETERLHPSVPMIVREVTHPIQIDGVQIPVGTAINIPIIALHRDPEVFSDPLKFDPDRFLPENCHNRHPYAFVPFSAGLRNCIGQKYAQMELKVLICQIIRRFKVESIQDPLRVRATFQLALRPAPEGIWLKFSKR